MGACACSSGTGGIGARSRLCAATLLRYPRYLNRSTNRFTTPEVVIDQLRAELKHAGAATAIKLTWSRRQARKLVQIYRGVRG